MLYCPGNYIWCLIITYNEKESVYIKLNHFAVYQKLIQHCKSVLLQMKTKSTHFQQHRFFTSPLTAAPNSLSLTLNRWQSLISICALKLSMSFPFQECFMNKITQHITFGGWFFSAWFSWDLSRLMWEAIHHFLFWIYVLKDDICIFNL